MTLIDQAQIQAVRIQVKNGELNFSVQIIDFQGSLRPFIIRTLKLSSNQQTTKTQQHTLIQSIAELDDWIAQDVYSMQFPGSFSQLKKLCSPGLK